MTVCPSWIHDGLTLSSYTIILFQDKMPAGTQTGWNWLFMLSVSTKILIHLIIDNANKNLESSVLWHAMDLG